MALTELKVDKKISGSSRGSLARAFGRHPLVRAIEGVDAGAFKLTNPVQGLYLVAEIEEDLKVLQEAFEENWLEAINVFGAPPTLLVQCPRIYSQRLAATPTAKVAFINFPTVPSQTRELTLQEAKHEICHTFVWSGRRFLDEGMADYFAGQSGVMDPADLQGPSTRSLIEQDNSTNLHFEEVSGGPISALRIRRRAYTLASDLVSLLGWIGTRDFYQSLLSLPSGHITDAVEQALGENLDSWDDAKKLKAGSSVRAAFELVSTLDQDETPASETLRELDAYIRDARRDGSPRDEVLELLGIRHKLMGGQSGAKINKVGNNIRQSTKMANKREAELIEQAKTATSGVGLKMDGFSTPANSIFQLRIDKLSVLPIEKIGLVGENGAGKSTLLNLLARAETSSLTIDSVPAPQWINIQENRARLGTSLNEYPCHPNALVREVLALHKGLYGAPDVGIAEMFDMTEHIDKPLNELSLGWRKVMSLYFAFAHNPNLVLLDEPSTGLDEKHAASLRKLLKGEVASKQQTIITSTHVGLDIEHADRIIVMNSGKISGNFRLREMFKVYGTIKVTVENPEAIEFGEELKLLPGQRGVRQTKNGLQIFGDEDFGEAFREMADHLSLRYFGIKESTTNDLLQLVNGER